jgi:hypothetical protein
MTHRVLSDDGCELLQLAGSQRNAATHHHVGLEPAQTRSRLGSERWHGHARADLGHSETLGHLGILFALEGRVSKYVDHSRCRRS